MGPDFRYILKPIGLHKHTNRHIQYQFFLINFLGTMSQKFISKVNICVWLNYWSPNRDFKKLKKTSNQPFFAFKSIL